MEYPLIVILAFTMASKESDFEKHIKDCDEMFISWQDRNNGDFKTYLDSKIIEFSKPKNIKTLKKQVYFIALYKVKKELPSKIFCDYIKKYEHILHELDKEKITWQDLYDKINSLKLVDNKKIE